MLSGGGSLRTRVILAVAALLALALAAITITDVALQRQQVFDRMDSALDRRWEELIALTETGVDPQTGRPFETAEQLVRVALQRTVPAPNEGELGIVAGGVRWTAQSEVPTRLESDPQFLAHVLPLATGDAVVRGSITTSTTRYQFIVVPIALAPDAGVTAGAVVFAFDASAELEPVIDSIWWRAAIALTIFAAGTATIWVLMGRLLRPIARVRDTARDITETDLSRRIPVTGTDDLAELTTTVNTMLDRLEGALTSQRELLDDVGHELRTPLTIVRGHLELMDPDDPMDARSTRELVVDEIDRMNRLVGDLTLLAAAGRPDFATLERVHVGLLVDDALERARTLGDRRWRLGEFLDEEAMLDPQRITQALLQLASNAVRYSEPGTAITFGASASGDRIRLSVTDEGRGVPPDRLSAIFDRFTRVRTPGERTAGAGLGLAIVRGIVAAHGGTVEVESEVHRGSSFTLALPRSTPSAGNAGAGVHAGNASPEHADAPTAPTPLHRAPPEEAP